MKTDRKAVLSVSLLIDEISNWSDSLVFSSVQKWNRILMSIKRNLLLWVWHNCASNLRPADRNNNNNNNKFYIDSVQLKGERVILCAKYARHTVSLLNSTQIFYKILELSSRQVLLARYLNSSESIQFVAMLR